MRGWLEGVLSTVGLIWLECLVGVAVVIVGIPVGWWLAHRPSLWPVRFMRWWVDHVVGPLLASRSWARRAAIIATNNILMLGLTVACGAIPLLGWAFVAWVGVALGIALNLMMATPDALADEREFESPPHSALFTLGMALNMLEPPVIMCAAGLALAQGALSEKLSLADAMGFYATVLAPMLVVAAAGESLWMGQRKPMAASANDLDALDTMEDSNSTKSTDDAPAD